MPDSRRVTLVSHGPNCLDGLTCAVVATRYFAGRDIETVFANNNEIDDILQGYTPAEPTSDQLWVTDISWRSDSTDEHLNRLIHRGLEFYWIDHHKTAIDRRTEGHLNVDFTDFVLSDRYAASRLLFEYLVERAARHGESRPGLLSLRNLVMLADDVDRWVLRIDGSRDLALAVRAMDQEEAYRVLLSMDSNLTYGPELTRAARRVRAELDHSFELADRTRHVREVAGRNLRVVSAECDGYAGEVAARWSDGFRQAVFVIYDHRTRGVSLRRSADCGVDLSRLAAHFGGGGHAAAAGCQVPASQATLSADIAAAVAQALADEVDR